MNFPELQEDLKKILFITKVCFYYFVLFHIYLCLSLFIEESGTRYAIILSIYLFPFDCTAKEWQNWLLYLAVPVLQGILPEVYIKNLEKLVRGIRILLQKEFTIQEVRRAKVYFIILCVINLTLL